MTLEIANRLQQLRKENGYSQEELANKLGISRQAVSKWERAESSPDTDNLICLAKLYGISLDELLQTEDDAIEFVKDTALEENDNYENEEKENHVVDAINASATLIIVASYFVLGAIFSLWHPGWIVFLLIPIFISLVEAIKNKNPEEFAFPVLIAAIYLLLGFVFSLWHPGWIVFLLIPIYYGVCDIFDKD